MVKMRDTEIPDRVTIEGGVFGTKSWRGRVGVWAVGLGHPRGDIDKEVSPTMSIAPRKPMLKVAANMDSVLLFQGLHDQPKQHLQGGDDTTVPLLSDPAIRI
jgi:GH24 family phage-related lysozyme (muramidase)